MHSVITSRPSGSLDNLLANPMLGARRVSYQPKTPIYGPDDAPDTIYFIHQGQVRTYLPGPNNSRRLLEILGAGGWCGVAAVAELPRYGEGAEAVTPTIASAVPIERLMVLLVQHRSAAIELMKQLAAKLTRAHREAAGLVFEDCNHRLVRTLMQLSESPAASPANDGVVLRITHQQLAQAVGVARETVTLALAQLRRRNLLRTGRNRLMFDPRTLRASALTSATPANGHSEPQSA